MKPFTDGHGRRGEYGGGRKMGYEGRFVETGGRPGDVPARLAHQVHAALDRVLRSVDRFTNTLRDILVEVAQICMRQTTTTSS